MVKVAILMFIFISTGFIERRQLYGHIELLSKFSGMPY